ncbi:putative dTDP-glucose 4,6-dehydratase [Megalodesulfovibrio gigas DSM 1382 = ATCC 19364]|uniref:dTDP-glucose 4,6-dehydratase n=1 Tax=Megalodesulfovibrio gigas (strain ATCC 19364 / DSM 1382 / NCIMB 9332 / VKM B-1759) TaxID=1121448 RepID=T2G7Z0_MEGG1|nr:putative dTDP-glucose 4,6-dehydratase [Megalodesulfovibrio gigas DSM 1382 = ATCC 19364]
MRLLVTGGCGFIGANYLYYLFETDPDCVVVNLDKLTYAGNLLSVTPLEERHGVKHGDGRYVFAHGDIADAELVTRLVEEHRIEAIVNFAAESHVDRSINDPTPFMTTNILGAQNLLQVARAMKLERIVHVSTDEVYGTLGPDGKFTEATPLAPNSPYSASKAAADLLCRAWFHTYNTPVVVTRCSNNYGPFQFPEKLIPLMITKAKADQPLPVYGDGQNVRDWIYVRDHCRGVDLALRKGTPGEAYNFGGNAEKTNIDVVKTILTALGKPESLITYVQDRPGHDRRYAMDYSLAERTLGFTPEYTFTAP